MEEKYAEKLGVPVEVVQNALTVAEKAIGGGYIIEYYWEFMARSLCVFYKAGYKAAEEAVAEWVKKVAEGGRDG